VRRGSRQCRAVSLRWLLQSQADHFQSDNKILPVALSPASRENPPIHAEEIPVPRWSPNLILPVTASPSHGRKLGGKAAESCSYGSTRNCL